MPPPTDQLIEWVLRDLAASGSQGLSIAELLQSLDKNAIATPGGEPLDGPTRTRFWEALIDRDDINFGEGASAAALKKLSLDDIIDLGLDARTLKLRESAGASHDGAPTSQTLELVAPNSNDVVPPTDSDPLLKSVNSTKPKRRGRPPGKVSKKRVPTTQAPVEEPPPSTQIRPSSSGAASPQPELIGTSISSSRPATPIATTPAEGRPSPRRTPQRTLTTSWKQPRTSFAPSIKKAKFTPYDEIQREEDDSKIEAGITGVYINPTIALLPEVQQGKNIKKRVIAVFKSAKLKIPQWLAARRGSWKEEFVKRTQKDPDSALQETQGPAKAPARRGPSKKQKGYQDDVISHPSRDILQPPNQLPSTLPSANIQAQDITLPGPNALPQLSNNPPQQPLYLHHPPGPVAPTYVNQVPSPGFKNGSQPNIPSSGQPIAPHPIPKFAMPPPPQPTYQSPYRSPYSPAPSPAFQSIPAPAPTPALQSVPAPAPPAPAPAYKSPYQSAYQSLYQSPYQSIAPPTTQPQNFPSTSEFPAVSAFLGSQTSIHLQDKGKRKASVDYGGPPDKRHKTISAPAQTLPVTSNVLSPAITTTTTPQDPILEAILKQQEQEKAKEAQKERELQDKLSVAELADVPEHLVRLAAAYDNKVGNLLLSRDKSTLSFISVEELTAGTPILIIPVSALRDNPLVSIPGSKPMELRVRSRNGADVEVLSCFNIGLTQAARKAADIMRAKLVLAKINARAIDVSSESSEEELDEAKFAILKPFLCEKCGKRFKNKEGILYHSTKSQTTCNPTFDPSTVLPRPTRVRVPKKKKEKRVKIVEPRRPVQPSDTTEAQAGSGHDGEGQPESDSSDSLDSIIEWAEKVSRSKKRSKSSRRRRGAAVETASNNSNEERASPSTHSNNEGSDLAALSSSEEEYESMEEDFYYPENEKTTRHSASKRAMQRRWARAKAVGANKLTGDADLEELQAQLYKPSSLPRPPKRAKMLSVNEERQRRINNAERKLQCWDSPPPLLPNAETGAWDQMPVRGKRAHRKLMRRYELPEPITYMQEQNGAWSIRPFGHGVKPIYARPSRRADGNPFLPVYLKRLENGFRPVIMPTKNRLFLPATPAKRLLEDPTSYTPPSSIDDLGASSKRRKFGSVDGGENSVSRVSKATGKPVRPYRRPKPVLDGQRVGNAQDLDHIHVLNALEPIKLDPSEGQKSNPGLDSLPASFGFGSMQSTEDQLKLTSHDESNQRLRDEIPMTFSLRDIVQGIAAETQPLALLGIDQVATWEQGRAAELLENGTLNPEFRWLNHTVDVLEGSSDLQHIKITWDDNRSFDITTLPYSQLDEIQEAPMFDGAPASAYRVPRSSLKPASQNARDNRELRKGWTTRRMTALESDLAGLGASPEKIAREMGAQIAPLETIQRTRHGDSQMSTEEDMRLMVSICVIRTLTGGLDQNIDWVLVSQMFRTFSMNFLNKRWTALLQKRKAVIEKLMADFQDAFLIAYKNDEVPRLDYDNLVAYDWSWLVDWTMKTLDVTVDSKAIQLPDTRERLDKLYNIKEQNTDNSRQEGYYSLTYPVYKRMDLASSVANTSPAFPRPKAKCADDITIDTFTLVKSWVRAAALTPEEAWNPQIIKRMFKSLNDPSREDRKGNDSVVKKLVDNAAEALKDEKVLMQKNKGRAVPDRSYEPTDVFFGGFRKHIAIQQVVEAAQFKRYLDQEFSRGTPCVRSDYLANEGTLMCVTQLQAHGRIRLRPVGVPKDKFGLGGGSYETRKIPKERFRFDMDIYPTTTYIHDADIEVLQLLKRTEPPRGSAAGELPVWYGIGGRLIAPIWHKALVAFSGIIALRAGTAMDGLKKIFKPTLEEWEMWRLLEWGFEHGIFERLHPMVDGWTTGEWWWLIVGWYCAGEV